MIPAPWQLIHGCSMHGKLPHLLPPMANANGMPHMLGPTHRVPPQAPHRPKAYLATLYHSSEVISKLMTGKAHDAQLQWSHKSWHISIWMQPAAIYNNPQCSFEIAMLQQCLFYKISD